MLPRREKCVRNWTRYCATAISLHADADSCSDILTRITIQKSAEIATCASHRSKQSVPKVGPIYILDNQVAERYMARNPLNISTVTWPCLKHYKGCARKKPQHAKCRPMSYLATKRYEKWLHIFPKA